MKNKSIKILSTRIDTFTKKEVLERIEFFLTSNQQHQIITINSEMLVDCQEDKNFMDIINNSSLVVPDGMGILRMANFQKKRKRKSSLGDLFILLTITLFSVTNPKKIKDPIKEKISGIDLMHDILEEDFMSEKRIYLIGAGEGIAQKTKQVLEKKYKKIKIVGAEEGVVSGEKGEKEDLTERVNEKKPDMIFLALGAPKQEKWIYENLNKMKTVKVAIGVGGSFDFISGEKTRAPRFMQNHGMEWLWRMALEPKRFRRIYKATIKSSWLIFCDRIGTIEDV